MQNVAQITYIDTSTHPQVSSQAEMMVTQAEIRQWLAVAVRSCSLEAIDCGTGDAAVASAMSDAHMTP